MELERPHHPTMSMSESTGVSAETAYHILEMNGPVGIPEMENSGGLYAELPAPQILDVYFQIER